MLSLKSRIKYVLFSYPIHDIHKVSLSNLLFNSILNHPAASETVPIFFQIIPMLPNRIGWPVGIPSPMGARIHDIVLCDAVVYPAKTGGVQ